MRNILLVLSYDGGDYCGFQLQKKGATVQGTLGDALRGFTGEEVKLISSGRTDAGVHALAQVVNFTTRSRYSPETFLRVLNSRLPGSIRVLQSMEAPAGFHARKWATGKVYRYVIYNGPVLPPFLEGYVWHLSKPLLDVELLTGVAAEFVGEHDFRAFMGSGSSVVRTVRRVEGLEVSRMNELVSFTVTGKGFLKNMVRNVVGTMVDVCAGKIDNKLIGEILGSRDRRRAGRCAPGCGLYLMGVDYPTRSFRGRLPFFLDF